MKTSSLHWSTATSSPVSPDARRRTSKIRHAREIAVALVAAFGLFVLIAFLDGIARPNDISPGTALAASRTMPTVDTGQPSEVWAADTSAEGTRPDASH